jgi:WD40 repeat protein
MEFFSRYKKIFFLAGFLLIVIGLGYAIYALFFRPSITPTVVDTGPVETSTGNGLPTAQTGTGQIVSPEGASQLSGEPGTTAAKADPTAQGGLTETAILTEQPTVGATVAGNGSDVQYYNSSDGKFYRTDKNGRATELSSKVFHEVKTVVWSPDKNSAVLEYPDGANIIYDFSTGKQVTLPAHWKDFSFSPDGGQIALKSMGEDPDNRWLAVVSKDGSKMRGVERIGENDASVYSAWSPNNQMIAMYTEGVDFDRQEVYFVGLNGENFKSTVVEGRGLDPKWSPTGHELVYSVYSSANSLKPNLWAVVAEGDQIGNNRRNLEVETWASKCSFSGGTKLYCAVPQNLEKGAGLFPELAEHTADRLYQIDLTTGGKKMIAIPQGDYTISNILVSDDNKNLYFNDKNSGKLYKIKLK